MNYCMANLDIKKRKRVAVAQRDDDFGFARKLQLSF